MSERVEAIERSVKDELSNLAYKLKELNTLVEQIVDLDESTPYVNRETLTPIFEADDDNLAEFSAIDNSQWMPLDEAYNEALQKGYKGSKDAFRKWVNRKPNEVRSQLGIIYDPDRSGRAGNYRPYRIQSEN